EQVVVHKTFHRYVVRAKRGGVQSQHDSSGKHAKSAGANIRRSQEAMFREEIKSLIGADWKAEIDQCSCVFIRVPQYNKSVLISGQNPAPFDKDDTRLRTIPFMTFRPTFNEVKRTHNLLSRVEQYDKDFLHVLTKYETKIVESAKEKPKSKSKPKKKKSSPKTEKKSQNMDTKVELVEVEKEVERPIQDEFIQSLSGDNLKLFNEIYTCCMTNNVVKLRQLLNPLMDQENKIDAENYKLKIEKLINKRLNKQNGFTLLHLCSQLGFGECVWELLMNGCDPSIADLSHGKMLPYFVSQNKGLRDLYRRFMHDYPNRYDYGAAKISEPLSYEKMAEKMEKEKEKKKMKKQARKEREAVEKEKLSREQMEENERKLFLSLTDQEKRQLLVDRNFLNLMPVNDKEELDTITKAKYSPQKIRVISRCWYCGVDMSSSVPFEYFDYKFCTTKCLKAHRQHQQEIKNLSHKPK
ncbi:ankyrin repeat and zinc finger domain-containing 1-like, partial [Brachionus plicatilis]